MGVNRPNLNYYSPKAGGQGENRLQFWKSDIPLSWKDVTRYHFIQTDHAYMTGIMEDEKQWALACIKACCFRQRSWDICERVFSAYSLSKNNKKPSLKACLACDRQNYEHYEPNLTQLPPWAVLTDNHSSGHEKRQKTPSHVCNIQLFCKHSIQVDGRRHGALWQDNLPRQKEHRQVASHLMSIIKLVCKQTGTDISKYDNNDNDISQASRQAEQTNMCQRQLWQDYWLLADIP